MLMVLSAFLVITPISSAQNGTFEPSGQMKIITQPGNNVTFPLGSVGISLPNAINPLYTSSQKPSGYITFVSGTQMGVLPYSFVLEAVFQGGLPPYTYQWLLNNKVIGYGQFLNYTANSAGSYTFTVEVTDQAFNTVSATYTVSVIAPLTISGTASNSTLTVGGLSANQVTKKAQLVTYANVPIKINIAGSGGSPFPYGYDVYYNPGKINDTYIETNTLAFPMTFNYTEIGTYVASFYLEDSNGAISQTIYFVINVTYGPLNASYIITTHPYKYMNGLPVYLLGSEIYFEGTVSGGIPPYTEIWNFGDNTTAPSSGPSPTVSHTYYKQGLYRVWFNVTDCMNDHNNTSQQFYIIYVPVSNATLRIGNSTINATQTTLTEPLINGQAYYWLNLTWEYGLYPYNVNITMIHNNSKSWHNTTIMYPSLNLETPFQITSLGTYYFNFTVTDAKGYSSYSNQVTLNVIKPTFYVTVSASPTAVCVPGTTTITITLHNIQGVYNSTTNSYNATVNYTLFMNGGNYTYNKANVTGSTEYFDWSVNIVVSISSSGEYSFYAIGNESYPVKNTGTSSTITVTGYSEHGLTVVSFGATPQSLIGTSPFQPMFYVNLTGGNGTLKYIFMSNHPSPLNPISGEMLKSGGPLCNPYYNFTFNSYVYSTPMVYNTQFTFYSNNSAYTGPVYVNFTVTVYPPKPLVVEFNMQPNLIYLEPISPLDIVYGPYNTTTITLNMTGGLSPFHISFFLGNSFMAEYTTSTGLSDTVYPNAYHGYLNFTVDTDTNFTITAYYNVAGLYNITADVAGSGVQCHFIETKTLVVVPTPTLSVFADAGTYAPSNVVGYGYAFGGALPYQSVNITIASQTFNGIIGKTSGSASGSVLENSPGTYTVTFTIVDHNGYAWSKNTTVTLSQLVTMYPIIVSASMQVYFNNNLVYSGPAVWNSSGTLNATFLMPNEQYASSQVYSVNASYSYLLYIPNGTVSGVNEPRAYFYNVYSPYPYNKVPGKLTVITGGMITGIDYSKDIVTIETMLSGTWQSVNTSYNYLKNTINPELISVSDGIVTIELQGAILQASLNNITENITGIKNGIVSINTALGTIQTTLSSINGQITSINNGIATISTSLGTIQTTLSSINGQITSIN
ncbi:MAG: PKD domain-containing protein, partial [Thermoplasmata archaeon]